MTAGTGGRARRELCAAGGAGGRWVSAPSPAAAPRRACPQPGACGTARHSTAPPLPRSPVLLPAPRRRPRRGEGESAAHSLRVSAGRAEEKGKQNKRSCGAVSSRLLTSPAGPPPRWGRSAVWKDGTDTRPRDLSCRC